MASAEEQTRRNMEIVSERAAGRTIREISEAHHLSPTRVKEILARTPEGETDLLLPAKLVQAADARRDAYADAVAEIRRLAFDLPDTQASAKVGALRLLLDGLDRLTHLGEALGHLVSGFHQLLDQDFLIATVTAVFREHRIPQAALDDLVDRLDAGRSAG